MKFKTTYELIIVKEDGGKDIYRRRRLANLIKRISSLNETQKYNLYEIYRGDKELIDWRH